MKTLRSLGAVWGLLGVTIIIGGAAVRLVPHALEALRGGLTTFEWTVLVMWSMFMLIGEGYRGFQKQFSPRVVERMRSLMNNGRPLDLILAPFYCMSYFHAPRKHIIASWALTAGIALVVIVVRQFPQPWRGIIDCGVVLGLMYGLAWIYILALRSFKSQK